MDKKKIAIIGANSFLGKSLIKSLQKDFYNLLLFARSKPLNLEKFEFEVFDYPKVPLNFEQLLNNDIIIYAAGAGIQNNLKESSEAIYQLNAFIPSILLNFLEEQEYQGKIFTFGSYFEIGNNNQELAFTEEELVSVNLPVPSHYCSSKRLLTKFYSNKIIKRVQWYHLILPTIYGPNENGNRIIPYILGQIQKNETIILTEGTQIRQYLFINDLIQLILSLLNSSIKAGIYNVGAADELSVLELATLLKEQKQSNVNIKVGAISRNDISMKILKLNPDKLYKNLMWRPKLNLKNSIKFYHD